MIVFLLGYSYFRINDITIKQINQNLLAMEEINENNHNNNYYLCLFKSIQLYKSLTLLNNLFNQTFGKLFIPVLKTSIELLIPPVIFVSIRLYMKILTLPFLAFLPFLGLICIAYQFGLIYFLSKVYVNSLSSLNILQGNYVKRSKSQRNSLNKNSCLKLFLFKKLLRTCRIIKVKVGSFYFVDRFLTLNVLRIIVDSVLFLLINF